MMKQLIYLMPLLLSACLNAADNGNVNSKPDLSKGVIQTIPKNVNIVIDSSGRTLSHKQQTVTFTNIGAAPVTQLMMKGFKDESAPLYQTGDCDKDLAAGGSCSVTIGLTTNHKFAESGPIFRSTVMTYEYNDGSEKKVQKLGIRFSVERWVASLFITDAVVSGKIVYPRSDDLPLKKAGADSADYFCHVDKNNPQNGYTYQALIYDTRNRTPYLHWVLFGGQTYYSVMPGVYHQKVWQTSYKQATATKLVANIYNCIGVNCALGKTGDDAAWVGLQLNGNALSQDNCGDAGNAWRSETDKFHGLVSRLNPEWSNHVTMTSEDTSCQSSKKIICVSM
ncbi:MAG: hypothetical protein K0R14_1083 [Burkholderiales bacterium]|jgi:hypothetical protein|nr:hypothetical protein [Burkholderiales bacterium]